MVVKLEANSATESPQKAESHSAISSIDGTRADPLGNIDIDTQAQSLPIASGSSLETSSDDLASVGLIEFLEIDERPIFMLDLKGLAKEIPVYQNASMDKLQVIGVNLNIDLAVLGRGATSNLRYAAFLDWAASTNAAHHTNGELIAGDLGGLPTESLTNHSPDKASQRGTSASKASERPQLILNPSPLSQEYLEEHIAAFRSYRQDSIPTYPTLSSKNSASDKDPILQGHAGPTDWDDLGIHDITRPHKSMVVSPHLKFFLNYDWGSTELGPLSSWSVELRRMCNFLMKDPRPAALYWGEKRIMMYNEPYVVVTGHKHPGMMGKTFSEAWAEVSQDFDPAFQNAYENGTSFILDDARFFIERYGYLEETYYSISVIPFAVNDDHIAFYNPVFETTKQVVTDRRMSFLLRLGQYIASSREPKDFWQQLLRGLEVEHFDLPFALLYSAGWDVNETLSESSEQSHNLKNWVLEGLVRVPEPHDNIPRRLNSEEEIDAFLPTFAEMIKADQPSLLLTAKGMLPTVLAQTLQTADGKNIYEAAIFLPIRSTGDTILGFMILGVNPWKRFDDDYKIFIELLCQQLATSMAAAVLFEDELQRGRLAAEQATLDRNLLSRKLAIQTHEASEIESRFRRMADLAPVGMFHIDPLGVLVYANNDWYNLTEHPRDVTYPMSWYNVIVEEDREMMDREWEKLLKGETVSFELRLRRAFAVDEIVGGEKIEGCTWIIASAYAENAEDGTVIGILGCLTDISRQKWAEGFQKRKMLEAIELKRQQENFIDMTSHEMRNPLSAILQCADWISVSLSEFDCGTKDITIPREAMESYADAAQTIVLCAQHQKRIIDDILTLSKLDSDLLYATPVEVQPISVIQNALKMFDVELQKNDVELRFRIEPSYQEFAIDWLKFDPSRLLQVFINLITNAIKFTQTETKRKIMVSLGASLESPQSKNGVEYLERSSSHKDKTLGTSSGPGEVVYLTIQVHDSGRGLNENERNLLFRRFSQASPRTHVQYGGSGLGLFISRRLTEIQGGQIGVASKVGVGSTFAFYIRTRRCDTPSDLSNGTKPDNSNSQFQLNDPSGIEYLQKDYGGKISENPIAPKYILIVEDNIVNQKVLSKQLRSAGCTVYLANHSLEALSFLETSPFWTGKETTGQRLSIVLMDLEMPVMDGLSCVRRIRELQGDGSIRVHVPIIAITANARSEQIAHAKEMGMDGVVTKPFRMGELMPEIEKIVRRSEKKEVEDIERSISAPP